MSHLMLRHVLLITPFKVYHAIDEYRDGGYRINKEFSAENYSRTYKGLIHSLEILKQDPYHREKWIRVRREWAEVGM